MKRRTVLQIISAVLFGARKSEANPRGKSEHPNQSEEYGCLMDATLCVGCRECEKACSRANALPPLATEFSDDSVFESPRRPDAEHLTVVNRYSGRPSSPQNELDETYIKIQCMHCLEPACVSACIVGALTKTQQGPVIYDADKCIGCRYCMVACPFQIPAYEYDNPWKPQVRKCNLCFEKIKQGEIPACAEACPREAIVFGKRSDLIETAKTKIRENPGRYINHVYGEHEVGGTSWLYLTGRPPEELEMPALENQPPSQLTESIQHGVFKYGLPPLAVYGALGGMMWMSNRKNNSQNNSSRSQSEEQE